MSIQLDLGLNQDKSGIEPCMEVPEKLSSRSEIRSLLRNELNRSWVVLMKEAVVWGMKQTQAEALELGF